MSTTPQRGKLCACGKHYHGSCGEARAHRYAMGEQGVRLDPATYYQCRFGGWHWTSSVYNSDGEHIATIQEVLNQYVSERQRQHQTA